MRKRALVAAMAFGPTLMFTGTAGAAVPGLCPSGFEQISVEEAASQGYPIAIVDVNNDGTACRRALGKGVFSELPTRPDTVYLWFDNQPGV